MKKLLFQLLIACLVTTAMSQRKLAPLPHTKNNFVLIAHRGDHMNVPENTLASIEEAIKCGVDYVEIDLRATKDGYLILSHDASIDRMTNGRGSVKDLSFEEIKELVIINPNKIDKQVYKIPQFKDVLELCKNKINIYLDFKDANVAESMRQIRAAGMEKQIVVYLNKPEQYQQWRDVAPDMPLMTSIPDRIKTPEQFNTFFAKTPIEVVDNIIDSAITEAVRQKGVATWLDVEAPNEGPITWNDAIGKDVQGLQTDHPETLVKYLTLNKRPK